MATPHPTDGSEVWPDDETNVQDDMANVSVTRNQKATAAKKATLTKDKLKLELDNIKLELEAKNNQIKELLQFKHKCNTVCQNEIDFCRSKIAEMKFEIEGKDKEIARLHEKLIFEKKTNEELTKLGKYVKNVEPAIPELPAKPKYLLMAEHVNGHNIAKYNHSDEFELVPATQANTVFEFKRVFKMDETFSKLREFNAIILMLGAHDIVKNRDIDDIGDCIIAIVETMKHFTRAKIILCTPPPFTSCFGQQAVLANKLAGKKFEDVTFYNTKEIFDQYIRSEFMINETHELSNAGTKIFFDKVIRNITVDLTVNLTQNLPDINAKNTPVVQNKSLPAGQIKSIDEPKVANPGYSNPTYKGCSSSTKNDLMWALASDCVHIVREIPKEKMGLLMGRLGDNIKGIQYMSSTVVHKMAWKIPSDPKGEVQGVLIAGSPTNLMNALDGINTVLAGYDIYEAYGITKPSDNKTVLCQNFEKEGECRFGESCRFVHAKKRKMLK